jgi:hypothetical protein
MRRQVAVVLGCHACLLAFVPVYTRVRISRIVMAGYWMGLAALFVANLTAAHGLWYSGQPQLVRTALLGVPYHTVVARPLSLLQYAYAVYFASFLLLALACAAAVFRRGERLRSATFAAAIAVIFGAYFVDFTRDSIGATWPYMGELGFAAWALIMSVQLGHDFRAQTSALDVAIAKVDAQAARLRKILDALRALDRKMHAPIELLGASVDLLVPGTAKEDVLLQRLRRAVVRLRDCARSMPGLVAPRSSDDRHTAAT